MNIKIQGGGGRMYSNKGSCTAIVSYLQHEDMDRGIDGKPIEPFFNNEYDKVSSKEVTFMIDHNKAQLHRNDSKFFVVTVSPSQEELKAMGKTPMEKSEALRNYVRDNVMEQYAGNFNKNLKKENIMYYAKIHHDRGDKAGDNMHCHIIVSRKDRSNSIKISPQTNHKNTKKGVVKGGFNRENFIQNCEKSFDKSFSYDRAPENSFEYLNVMKNGGIDDMKMQTEKAIAISQQKEKPKEIGKSLNNEKDIEL
ncbi:DUF5712 family protein [Dysgonomonas sp. ZJ279]|uniref:DUF5712 family protein n=1 Tax=Dysgonomonas sp. ZJ279 TaxID=2709796 RepID=UPI0013EC7715|nr:DUF5712 family protein [Dysgonomonas sp. ZJ279]